MQRRRKAVLDGVTTAHPIFLERASGSTITDVDGNTFLDFTGGIGVMNVGHTRAEVVAAVQQQAERCTHACFQVVGYEGYVAVAEALCRLMPGDFEKRALLITTGAEAVENAIKIARGYTRRGAVLCFEHGYHGRTLLTLTLTGKALPYKAGFGPYAPDIYRLPFPYSYRDGDRPRDPIEVALKTEVRPEDLAAVILEPVLGEGGFLVAPAPFVAELRAFCDRHGIVLIADEIQSGFGRTGTMFASQQLDMRPDLMTVAKSIAGGLPLAGVVGRATIMDAIPPGGTGGTFGGNPVACAAALQAMALLETEIASGRPAAVGRRIQERMQRIARDVPLIGDVRGLGPMQAIELVRDRTTREPAATETLQVIAEARARGVLLLSAGTHGNVVRFLVPLTVPDDLLDEGLDVIEQALRATAAPARK
ncbi:MAG TPA: 4-aminobutyrate--2-oxoglutarate transaminase [Polyangia bacterium]|jgi:4-aminobutyrate aminotransferase/(S)-3-amino-2-methylpropionate transaminase|nr:4-aminobutyrate--2-oxoglutarate transaminase [Polyangia bacterium]